jgi:hypothetical protein
VRWCSTGARAPCGTTGREPEAIAALEEALALLPADQVTRAHAVVLSSLAMSVWRANDMDATMSLAARAVQAAREVGAVQQEADSSITLGSARGYLSADDAGLDDLRAGLALATGIGAHFTALRAYVNISDVLELLGRHRRRQTRPARGWRWPTGRAGPVPGCLPGRQPG